MKVPTLGRLDLGDPVRPFLCPFALASSLRKIGDAQSSRQHTTTYSMNSCALYSQKVDLGSLRHLFVYLRTKFSNDFNARAFV